MGRAGLVRPLSRFLSYGSYENRTGQIYAAGPLSDQFAAGVDLSYRKSNNYLKDAVTGADAAPIENSSARLKLLFQPSEGNSLQLDLIHTNIDDPTGVTQQAYQGNSVANRSAPGTLTDTSPYQISRNFQESAKAQVNAAHLIGNFSLGSVALKSLTGYRKERAFINVDADISAAPIVDVLYRQDDKAFSQELIASSTGQGPLQWTTGANYYHSTVRQPFNYTVAGTTVTRNQVPQVETDSYAAFVDATYNVLPKLYLTVGARYSRDRREFTFTTFSNPPLTGDATKSYGKVTPRGVLRYELAPNTSIYASVSRGFKSGQFNSSTTSLTPVNPETITAYEVGYKTYSSRWSLAASAYYYDYKNLQYTARIFQGATLIQTLLNAASSTIYGADIDATVSLTDELRLRVAGAYTHARYDSFPGALGYTPTVAVVQGQAVLAGNTSSTVDAAGDPMVRSPDWTGTINLNYDHRTSMGTVGIAANIYASSRISFYITPGYTQSPYAVANANVHWVSPDDRWTATLYLNNAFDTRYKVNLQPSTNFTGVNYAAPRTVAAEIAFKID